MHTTEPQQVADVLSKCAGTSKPRNICTCSLADKSTRWSVGNAISRPQWWRHLSVLAATNFVDESQRKRQRGVDVGEYCHSQIHPNETMLMIANVTIYSIMMKRKMYEVDALFSQRYLSFLFRHAITIRSKCRTRLQTNKRTVNIKHAKCT